MKAAFNLEGVPTAERFIQSNGNVEVGGDDRGTRVYRFKDSALARVYSHLNAHAKTEGQRSINRAQEKALERYYTAYAEGGLLGNMGSVDCDRAGASNPSGRDHAAKTDFQVDARADWHRANYALSNNERIVVEVVVLNDCSLEQAGRALGKLSQRRAIQAARDLLRKAGDTLVELWR